MVRRSSVIFAASLAVFSTFGPALGFAAAAPAQHQDDAERPRFLKREVKRYLPLSNTTSSRGPNPPFGESSLDLESLSRSSTPLAISITPESITQTTNVPATSEKVDQGGSSQSEGPQSSQQLSKTSAAQAIPSVTPLPPTSSNEAITTIPSIAASIIESNPSSVASLPGKSSTEGLPQSATSDETVRGPSTPVGRPESSSAVLQSVTATSQAIGNTPLSSAQPPPPQSSVSQPPNDGGSNLPAGSSITQPSIPIVPGPSTTVGGQTASSVGSASDAHSVPSVQPVLSIPTLSRLVSLPEAAQSSSGAGQQSVSEQPNPNAPASTTAAGSQQISVPIPSVSNPVQQSVSEQPNPNAPASTTAAGPLKASIPVPSVANSVQLPIPQPSQSQSVGGGATGPDSTSAATAAGGSSNAAGVLPASVTLLPSNPPSAVVSVGINLPADSQNSQIGISLPASVSIGVSVGGTPIASSTPGAQPASSPALPNSAGVPPTVTSNPSTGENNVPASIIQQANSGASALLAASQPILANSASADIVGGVTPEGSALYSAVTAGLQNTVAPGSSVLPNGAVVPTATSAAGGVSLPVGGSTLQSGVIEQSGSQAQSSEALPIAPIPNSITLPGGSVVLNPSASAAVPAASITSPDGGVILNPSLSAVIPAASITLPGGSVVPNPAVSAVVPAASITLPGGSVVPNPSVPAVIPAASITLPDGSVILNPSASAVVPAASITLPGGSVIPNPSVSAVVPAASITLPGGSVVPNPSVSAVVPAASITLPDGNVVQNPSVSAAVPLASITLSNGNVIPNPSTLRVVPAASVTLPHGSVVSNPLLSNAASNTAVLPVIPASVTVPGGSVLQNPSATNQVFNNPSLNQEQSAIVTPPASGISNAGPSNVPLVSNTLQGSGALPQASATDSNGSIIPVQSNPSVNIGAVESGSAPISDTAPTGTLPIVVGSTSNTNGEFVPITAGQTTGSASLSGGSVVPLVASLPTPASGSSPAVVGSVTNSNGVAVPVTAGQATGSSTLSGGSVIPIVASAPTATQISGAAALSQGSVVPIAASSPAAGSGSSAAVVGSVANSNSIAVPITAGQTTGSSTLSDGSVVPLFAAAPTASPVSGSLISTAAGPGSALTSGGAAIASASENASPAAASGQTSIPFNQNGAIQTTGASPESGSAAGPPQSQLQAPAPVTGTATAPPNPAGTVQAQSSDQQFDSNAKGPFTQQPTGYDTATAQNVPTSILAGPSSIPPSQTSNYASTGLPTGWPLVLYPPGGAVKKPENTELIQIGFLYPLNYEFVWTHQDSQAQIFKYLPMGIAWGLKIGIENVTMQTLRAWDTTQDLHYVTTLALAFVPQGLVDPLGLLVHTPTSRFYHTPDNSTNTLLSMINIALPIAADNGTDGATNAPGASPEGNANEGEGGAPVGDGIGGSNPVRASSVGIGVGVAFGAVAYGAAMFFVARRYKKRRQSHLRSPSMFSSPVMSHVGPDAGAGAALMSGGMGGHRSPSPYHDNDVRAASRGSGRSGSTGRQQISAPVMAENSLGWN